MGIRVDIETSGNWFTKSTHRAIDDYTDDLQEDLVDQAHGVVLQQLGPFKNPTGYYRSNVVADLDRVHDNDLIYGWWLEGIGSRNFPNSIFHGYRHWQRSKRIVRKKAKSWAVKLLKVYERRF